LKPTELESLASLFVLKWGRRCFSRCLTQQRVKERHSMDEAAFCELCALFEAALVAAETNADYRCAKHLILMSVTFYRVGMFGYINIDIKTYIYILVGKGWSDNEVRDFIQHTLRQSEKITIWKRPVFWEEMFFGMIYLLYI